MRFSPSALAAILRTASSSPIHRSAGSSPSRWQSSPCAVRTRPGLPTTSSAHPRNRSRTNASRPRRTACCTLGPTRQSRGVTSFISPHARDDLVRRGPVEIEAGRAYAPHCQPDRRSRSGQTSTVVGGPPGGCAVCAGRADLFRRKRWNALLPATRQRLSYGAARRSSYPPPAVAVSFPSREHTYSSRNCRLRGSDAGHSLAHAGVVSRALSTGRAVRREPQGGRRCGSALGAGHALHRLS